MLRHRSVYVVHELARVASQMSRSQDLRKTQCRAQLPRFRADATRNVERALQQHVDVLTRVAFEQQLAFEPVQLRLGNAIAGSGHGIQALIHRLQRGPKIAVSGLRFGQ